MQVNEPIWWHMKPSLGHVDCSVLTCALLSQPYSEHCAAAADGLVLAIARQQSDKAYISFKY